MTDMLEKVARAIDPVAWGVEGAFTDDSNIGISRRKSLAAAQAALDAIGETHVVVPREPTREMCMAANKVGLDRYEPKVRIYATFGEAEAIYRAMLSAAQEDGDG